MIISANIQKTFDNVNIQSITFFPDNKTIRVMALVGQERKVIILKKDDLTPAQRTAVLDFYWKVTKGAFPEITETENPYNFEPEILDLGTIEEEKL